ncbi:MAG TPA: SurA N-terminal domain-containing protein [Gammaproteobacteria bacterium]|jgi:peptidyl-prolyl cis-trans isomerase D|nr:SurA N-terminal domain-containing protein [Gammaproteobacteria bacterium]
MVIQALRDNIPKWITGLILGLLVVPFALWGINSYFTASADNSAAVVNGDEITPSDYQRAYQGQYARLEQYYGEAFRPEMIDEKMLRQQVLDSLVNETLLNQQVAKDHYTVGDAQLVDAIQKMSQFQVEGKFSTQVYRSTLAASGLTPEEFERRDRQGIVVGQFQGSITDSAIATPAELAAAMAVRGQQRELSYLLVNSKPFLAKAQAGDAEIEAYYKAHQSEFMTPEKVTLAYVELDEAALAKQVQPSDAELQALYQQQTDKYRQDETRDARHILIAVKDGDPKADAAAKAKAEDILKQLKAGADFAKLARQYSDDPGSKGQGGDLGKVSRGVMVKPFEDALFGIAKVNDIAGPVKTQFGYHLIQLEGIEAAQVKSFAEVKPQLLADYQKKQADDKYFAMGDQLANLAYEHPESLDAVSKQLGLPVQVTGDVTRDGGEGIGANADVRKAAFSEQVLTQGGNSEPIPLGPNHAVVVRVKGHVPSEAIPLTQVKDKIAGLVKQQHAADETAKLAASLMDSLKKGADPAAAAKSAGAGVTQVTLGFVNRNQQGVAPQILSAAFGAPQPAPGAKSYASAQLDGGNEAVLVVSAVKPGDTASMTEQQRLAAMRGLSRQDGDAEFGAYLAYLKQKADIKVNTKNIDQSDQ